MQDATKSIVPASPVGSILPSLDERWNSDHQVTIFVAGREFHVRDQKTYNELCGLIDTLETIEGIERGLDDIKHGRVRTLEEMVAEHRQRYGLRD